MFRKNFKLVGNIILVTLIQSSINEIIRKIMEEDNGKELPESATQGPNYELINLNADSDTNDPNVDNFDKMVDTDKIDGNEAIGGNDVEYDQNENVKHYNEVKSRKREIKIKEIKERVKRKKEKEKVARKKTLQLAGDKKKQSERDFKEPSGREAQQVLGKPFAGDEMKDTERNMREDTLKDTHSIVIGHSIVESDENKTVHTKLLEAGENIKGNDQIQADQTNNTTETDANAKNTSPLRKAKQVLGETGSPVRKRETERKLAGQSEMTYSSTGNDSVTHEKTESNCDTNSSVTTSTNSRNENPEKILSLCQKGDWIVLEQILRNTKKGNPLLSRQDKVSDR